MKELTREQATGINGGKKDGWLPIVDDVYVGAKNFAEGFKEGKKEGHNGIQNN